MRTETEMPAEECYDDKRFNYFPVFKKDNFDNADGDSRGDCYFDANAYRTLCNAEPLGVAGRVISLDDGAVTLEYSLILPNVTLARVFLNSLRYCLFSLSRANFASSL